MPRKDRMLTCIIGPIVAAFGLLALGDGPPPKLGDPLPGLSPDLLARFQAGRAAFQDESDVADGLGPVFNDTSCVACHDRGGVGGGSGAIETRFGRVEGGTFDPLAGLGGSLIQSRGIPGFAGEVVPPEANVAAGRRATPLFGLGLVEAVPDETFVAIAAAQDPAIRGRPAVVFDVAGGQQRVGRFGWKCQQATLLSFSGDAYVNEMGINNFLFPDENCPQGDCTLLADDPAPGVTAENNEDVFLFADFMRLLAPPPLGVATPPADAGARTFAAIGCAACHVPTLRTGPDSVAAFDRVAFNPFSDFLLHDMGALGDGIEQAGAGPREMRTAPLWGVGAIKTFLHDGRAGTLADAILAHDGQGRAARDAFAALSSNRRAQLIAFLKSL